MLVKILSPGIDDKGFFLPLRGFFDLKPRRTPPFHGFFYDQQKDTI